VKVISVIGLKGGSGKTSTAVPLAYEASQRGTTVLLDLDPTLSATQWLEAADMTGERLMHAAPPLDGLTAAVRGLRATGEVEYLVLDTPPVSREACMLAAGQADLVVIPVHVGTGDLAQVVQTLDLLDMPRRANPKLEVRALLNHAGTMPAVTRETRAALEGAGLTVVTTEIPSLRVYVTAKGTAPDGRWPHFAALWTEIEGLL